MAAVSTRKYRNTRPTLPIVIVSNKFALSDTVVLGSVDIHVVLVSWVDSAEIASLVEEISI